MGHRGEGGEGWFRDYENSKCKNENKTRATFILIFDLFFAYSINILPHTPPSASEGLLAGVRNETIAFLIQKIPYLSLPIRLFMKHYGGIGWKEWKDGLRILKIVNAKMKIILVQRLFYFLIYFSRIP